MEQIRFFLQISSTCLEAQTWVRMYEVFEVQVDKLSQKKTVERVTMFLQHEYRTIDDNRSGFVNPEEWRNIRLLHAYVSMCLYPLT